jgi:hypothetical protein
MIEINLLQFIGILLFCLPPKLPPIHPCLPRNYWKNYIREMSHLPLPSHFRWNRSILKPNVTIRAYSFRMDRSTRIIDYHLKGCMEGGFLKISTSVNYY